MTVNEFTLDNEQSTSHIGNAEEKAAVLQRLIDELLPLATDDRRNLIETLSTFFGLNQPSFTRSNSSQAKPLPQRANNFQFSETSEAPSPKAFMFNKSPRTDVERVACLAYYLAHYRSTPHFKTKDITSINTESAHRPFSNTAVAVDNAAKMGYLVPSVKGSKQLSAIGEQFVEALPDREAARQIFDTLKNKRNNAYSK